MSIKTFLRRSLASTVTASLVLSVPGTAMAGGQTSKRSARVSQLPAGTQRPTSEIQLSVGEGELITLPSSVASVWTSNPAVADVYVNNPRQIHLFGKDFGEATVFATTANGAVVYSTRVRVAQNLTSIDRMIKAAMPEANIKVTTVGQIAVLNGTVNSPEDSEQAQRLVLGLLNPGVNTSSPDALLKINVINRLKTATPLQVNLQVRIAEVSRNFIKNIGVNLATRDRTGGFQFGIGSGTRSPGTIGTPDLSGLPMLDASSLYGFPAGTISLPFNPATGQFVLPGTGTSFSPVDRPSNLHTAISLAGKLFGLDVLSALDLGERVNQVTTLSNPNLTALSGETGSFLAGGEIAIPISQGLGAISIEYKSYGVSLAYTPTVLSDGRISLRVRPEVSQLSSANGTTIGTTQVPGFITRRAETTVELGSGQSLVIGGLLQNNHDNSIDKAPGLGDVPVLGALFRSNGFQRNETELVIVITPYLVTPVNASEIKLPTDGYETPSDVERVLLGKLGGGKSGSERPMPTMAQPNGAPAIGTVDPAAANGPAPDDAPALRQPLLAPAAATPPATKAKKGTAIAAPGFSFN